MDKLDGIRLKLSRAWNQIKILKKEIDRFLDGNPYVPRVKFNGQSNELIVSAHIQKSPNPMWGVQIGEIIHNLHSSLDHAVWELAFLNRLREPKSKKNQFPIFESESGFRNDGVNKFLRGVSPAAIAIIKSEQPFPKIDGGTGEGTASPLWHLKELSNADKHRTLHVAGTLIETFNFKFPALKHDVSGVRRWKRSRPGPIQQDAVLGKALFPGVTKWPFTKSEVHCELRVGIAFDQGTPTVGGAFVFQTLKDIANRTERIIRRLAVEIFKAEL